MKKYLSQKDFIDFLNGLEVGKEKSLFVETIPYEDEIEGDTEECKFLKVNFCGDDIILYDTLRGGVDVIQSTPVAPWEDYAGLVFENLEYEGECKVYLKSKMDSQYD